MTPRQHMAGEKKPPVTSGKETIDCVVSMRGNGSICPFCALLSAFFRLVSTEWWRKAADLPFLVFISGAKCPLFPRQARMEIAFVLVRCFFSAPLLLSSTMCIQTPYSSNFFASFRCVFSPARPCFWTVERYLECVRVPSPQCL